MTSCSMIPLLFPMTNAGEDIKERGSPELFKELPDARLLCAEACLELPVKFLVGGTPSKGLLIIFRACQHLHVKSNQSFRAVPRMSSRPSTESSSEERTAMSFEWRFHVYNVRHARQKLNNRHEQHSASLSSRRAKACTRAQDTY